MANSTGHKATVSGIYASACHRSEIALSNGDTFPPCPACHKACTWILIQATH